MDISFTATILLPIGLGLFGFVEPCTVGAHMVFLGSQGGRPRAARLAAFGIFVLFRVTVIATFGALVALLGAVLVRAQTGFWLVFGALYQGIGWPFWWAGAVG